MAAVKATGRGGPRRGAGRKPQFTEEVRRNRVVVLLTDEQLETLQRLAAEAFLPTGTVAYQLLARGLARRRK
jgi:hypothetical protein